jgi:hypothetical protein
MHKKSKKLIYKCQEATEFFYQKDELGTETAVVRVE